MKQIVSKGGSIHGLTDGIDFSNVNCLSDDVE
jgi:hypothetical protein